VNFLIVHEKDFEVSSLPIEERQVVLNLKASEEAGTTFWIAGVELKGCVRTVENVLRRFGDFDISVR